MTPEGLRELIVDRMEREDASPRGLAFVLTMSGVNLLGVRGELLSVGNYGNNVGFMYKDLPRMLKRLDKEMAA